VSLHGFAEHRRNSMDLELAVSHAETALALSRLAGFQTMEGQTETLLGLIKLEMGDLVAADRHSRRAVEIHDRTGGSLDHARALHVLGLSLQAQGDHEAARRCWREALASLPENDTTPETTEFRQLVGAPDPVS
jgi:tetratricopeptide (TPR) repeat protein